MRLFKLGSKDKDNDSKPFYFKEIKGLDKLNVLTSYIKGESPEYQNDMAKLLMVLEGNLNLKTDNKNMEMDPGDVLLIQGGEKFKLNAKKGTFVPPSVDSVAGRLYHVPDSHTGSSYAPTCYRYVGNPYPRSAHTAA